jgi:5'-methylthioadenosine phosphorylase
MTKAVLGVIGGSGVYDLPGLEDVREERINYRANIDVLKRAGVTDLVSVSACGSFKPELYPGLFVLVDQFVDRTHKRESSFFGNGCVAHVSMAHPVGPRLQDRIVDAAAAEKIEVHRGGAYVCMEGPQFSSYAESLTYKGLDHDVIGMTAMPEAKLAREAEITYATIAMVTDYDCWHPEHDAVEVSAIIKVVHENAGKAARLIARLARDFPANHEPCPVRSDRALDTAIMTAVAGRVLSG